MRYCPNCGHQCSDTAKFCPICGSAIPKMQAADPVKTGTAAAPAPNPVPVPSAVRTTEKPDAPYVSAAKDTVKKGLPAMRSLLVFLCILIALGIFIPVINSQVGGIKIYTFSNPAAGAVLVQILPLAKLAFAVLCVIFVILVIRKLAKALRKLPENHRKRKGAAV